MCEQINNLAPEAKIALLGVVVSVLTLSASIVATCFAYKNLKEIKNQFFEMNRGNLVFFFEEPTDVGMTSTVLKNFGNSPAKLISLKIIPDLDWTKVTLPDARDISNQFRASNFTDVLLAPGHHIESHFLFQNYPDEVFEVSLEYITCGKTFKYTYTLNRCYTKSLLITSPSMYDELSALKEINHSILELSRRFL